MSGAHYVCLVAIILLSTLAISDATPRYKGSYRGLYPKVMDNSRCGCVCVKCTSWGSWGAWNQCTGPIYNLVQHRVRHCPENTCTLCPKHDRIQNQIRKCQSPIETCSPWGVWTDCSVPCEGAGTRQKEKICVTPDAVPTNPSTVSTTQETEVCDMGPCPEFKLVQTAATCLKATVDETTNDDEAPFVFNFESGKYRLKLVHDSGSVTCKNAGPPFPFGCNGEDVNRLLVSNNALLNKRGSILITQDQFDVNDGDGENTSFIQTSEYFDFEQGKTYNIWYNEAYSKTSLTDNSGETCVHVFVQEFPHPIRPSFP